MHHPAAPPGARSSPELRRAPGTFYSCWETLPARGTGAHAKGRRRHARFREKPNCHKCASPWPVWEWPVNSSNLLPDKDLSAAAPSLACAIRRQKADAEIPFLRTKIPFFAPPDRSPPAPAPNAGAKTASTSTQRTLFFHRPTPPPSGTGRQTVGGGHGPLWYRPLEPAPACFPCHPLERVHYRKGGRHTVAGGMGKRSEARAELARASARIVLHGQ